MAYAPESDLALLSRHAVTELDERRNWMQRLGTQSEPIALHCAALGLCGIATQLVWHPANDTLELLALPEPDLQGTEQANRSGPLRATAVALHEGVKLQFEIQGRVSPPSPSKTDPHWRLIAPLPLVIHRLQRRDAFRVKPPPAAPAELWLQTPGERSGERSVTVTDISATGIAFQWPLLAGFAPRPGERLDHCRLELSGTIPIDCTLVVSAVQTDGRVGDKGTAPADDAQSCVRVGSRFESLSPSAARAIQVYVNLAQTRSRIRRPQVSSRPTESTVSQGLMRS